MTYAQNQASTINFVPQDEIVYAGFEIGVDGVPGGKCNSIRMNVFTRSIFKNEEIYPVSTRKEILELICAIAPALNGGGFGKDDFDSTMTWFSQQRKEGLTANDMFVVLQNGSHAWGFTKSDLSKVFILAMMESELLGGANNIPQYVLDAIADSFFCRPNRDKKNRKSATASLQGLLIATRYLNK